MTRIVTSHYRYQRPPRKRKSMALEVPAVVKAAAVTRSDAATASVSVSAKPVAQADRFNAQSDTATAHPAIVTARRPGKRYVAVPDMTPEEHQRRGDAADALWREVVRRVSKEL